MPETGNHVLPLRDAGTLIVIRPQAAGAPLVLLAERAATMAFAGGAMVFPGGAVDPADHDLARSLGSALEPDDLAARVAAIRETIEECGLALTGRESVLPADRTEMARLALRTGGSLGSIIAEQGIGFDFEALVPFARWCPPSNPGIRRFDTRFYIALAGDWCGDLVPDGQETAGAGWYSAREMLERADRNEARILFPTRCNLERLAQFDTVEELLAHARAQPVEMISPWVETRGGEEHLCIPEGVGYPVTSRPWDTVLRQ